MSGAANYDYWSMFEYAPHPIGVIRDGVFVECNQAMLKLFALRDKADFVGARAGETFSPERQPDGERSRDKVKIVLEQCIEHGQTSFSWTSQDVNGDLLSAQVLLRALDDSESPLILLYIHDVSQLMAHRYAALNRKAYLQELLESSPAAFLVCDLNTGLICKINAAGRSMLGLSSGAWGTMRADQFLSDPADRFRFLRRLKKSGEATGEVLVRRLDGMLRHLEVTWRYNPGDNKELLCWGIDITEFKRAQHELELSRDRALSADNAKTEFLSRMSHELHTPMNAILGFGQLLQLDEDNLTKEQYNSVDHILFAGQRLLELIRDVLDFSKVNAGDVDMEIQRVPTLEALKGSIALVRPLANEAGVSVSAQTRPLPDVLADSKWLRQVLINLLSNAIKYNRPGGVVSVAGEVRNQGNVRIFVTDSGEGIQPQDAHRLFEPFEQISASRTRKMGTGIGLALCKRIMDRMGGRIGFESEPGIGSVFWIELPAAQGLDDNAGAGGKT